MVLFLDTWVDSPGKSQYVFSYTSCSYIMYSMISAVLGEIYSCFWCEIFCFGGDACIDLGGAYILPFLPRVSFFFIIDSGKYLSTTSDVNPICVGKWPFLWVLFMRVYLYITYIGANNVSSLPWG